MCNCVVEVTAKVASHLESQGVEIVGTPVMDAALMLDSMQLTTSTKIRYAMVDSEPQRQAETRAQTATSRGG